MRNIALTLLCAGLLAGNLGCGQKDDTSAATTPPPTAVPAAPPTTTPPTTGADATSAPAAGSPAVATPANSAAANTGATDAKPGKAVKLPDGLEYTDVTVGTGPSPQGGQTVVVHYTGTLTNGTKFDSSLDRNQPFEFMLGGGQVIKGWDEGVRGMKVGGVRKLVIPSELAYGKDGRPPVIPGSATLLFTIQMLEVK